MKPEDIRRTFEIADFCADTFGAKPVFYQKRGQRWYATNCLEYQNQSKILALGMLSVGFQKGENVATIFNYSCPQWNFIDMALSQIGAVNIPVYPTISDSDYLFILNQAEVRIVFVSDQVLFNKVSSLQTQIPTLEKIISVEKLPSVEHLDDIFRLGETADTAIIDQLEERRNSILPGDVVTIIYTMGSTGFPKGAMLTHSNILSSMLVAAEIQPLGKGNKVLSFLPMSHVYERTGNYQFQIKGAEIYYCESLRALMTNFLSVKPHGTMVVPRVLEKIIKSVIVNSRKRNFIIRMIVQWAVHFGYRYKPYQNRGRLYHLWHRLAYFAVFRRVRLSLGGHIKYIGCGGAPISDKVERFFWAARMPVYQGYGLSECSPLVALNYPGKGNYWIGSVGPVARGVEVKIAADGEILCKGPNVMKGYFKHPELTDETIKDGWLYTGDTGRFIRNRFLQITGRKKQMFKTSFGKYIVPQAIENKFAGCDTIKNIMVIGEGKHCAAAVISPDFNYFRSNYENLQKLSKNKIVESLVVKKQIQSEVEKINHQLGKTEQIKKYLIVSDEWGIETGELSASNRLKRNIIQHKYKRQIHNLFRDESL
jgi:long-chain acyl-CoA synthetase